MRESSLDLRYTGAAFETRGVGSPAPVRRNGPPRVFQTSNCLRSRDKAKITFFFPELPFLILDPLQFLQQDITDIG